ncbi:hypothetical protein MPNT_40030 [Candidatus Methylacidithermus pantelleriae]|uniref:Uncharacterized protein n=1 Tax=Candidatus Methylacidithermus pantelleriae TaxID=2744239 RepID=A0A8J2BN28_9BACT|nr:hypothetical protein MPNT_40030 [Candidatus Methylacidithermus pantelleriae]
MDPSLSHSNGLDALMLTSMERAEDLPWALGYLQLRWLGGDQALARMTYCEKKTAAAPFRPKLPQVLGPAFQWLDR